MIETRYHVSFIKEQESEFENETRLDRFSFSGGIALRAAASENDDKVGRAATEPGCA
jgi:hypothetical protein